jgi:hypothetical protein
MSTSTRQGEGDGGTERRSWGDDLGTWSGEEPDPTGPRAVDSRGEAVDSRGEAVDSRGEAVDSRGEAVDPGRTAADRPGVMIPARRDRLPLEAPLMRAVATAGIIGIGVVIAAIMASQHSQGWLIGLVVSAVSVVLAGILWSSRRL